MSSKARSLAALQIHAEQTYLQESVSDAIDNARKISAAAELALVEHEPPRTALNSPCPDDEDEAAMALVGLGDKDRVTPSPPGDGVRAQIPIAPSVERAQSAKVLCPKPSPHYQPATIACLEPESELRVTLRDIPRLLSLLDRAACAPRGATTKGGQSWTLDIPVFVLGQLTCLANRGGLDAIRRAGGVAAIERIVRRFSPPSEAVHALPILNAALKLLLLFERTSNLVPTDLSARPTALAAAIPDREANRAAAVSETVFRPQPAWAQAAQSHAPVRPRAVLAAAAAWALPPRAAATPQATPMAQPAPAPAASWTQVAAPVPDRWRSSLPRAAALPQAPAPTAAVAAALWGGGTSPRQLDSAGRQYAAVSGLVSFGRNASEAHNRGLTPAPPPAMPAAHAMPIAQAMPIAGFAPTQALPWRLPTPAVPAKPAVQATAVQATAVQATAVQATAVQAKPSVAAVPAPGFNNTSTSKRPRNDNVRAAARPTTPPVMSSLPANVRPQSPGARPLSPSVSRAPTAPSSPRPISPLSQQMAENRMRAEADNRMRAEGNLLMKHANVGAALYDLLTPGGSIPLGAKRQRLSKLAM